MDAASTKMKSREIWQSPKPRELTRLSGFFFSCSVQRNLLKYRHLWTVSIIFCRRDTVMSLTDTAIRNAKPKDQAYKLPDEKGLYLLVSPVGEYFQQDYRFGGKRKTLSHGVYPKLSLKEAREKRDEVRIPAENGHRSGGKTASNPLGKRPPFRWEKGQHSGAIRPARKRV